MMRLFLLLLLVVATSCDRRVRVDAVGGTRVELGVEGGVGGQTTEEVGLILEQLRVILTRRAHSLGQPVFVEADVGAGVLRLELLRKQGEEAEKMVAALMREGELELRRVMGEGDDGGEDGWESLPRLEGGSVVVSEEVRLGSEQVALAGTVPAGEGWAVQVEFTAEGRKVLGELTAEMVGGQLAVVVDGEVWAVVVVKEAITGGSVSIYGPGGEGLGEFEARALGAALRDRLPVALELRGHLEVEGEGEGESRNEVEVEDLDGAG